DAGAKVVVNDLGGSLAGEGADLSPAQQVVGEIEAAGGQAVADGENVADFAGAGRLVQHALDAFGRLDILVNNAGILRDRMLVNMTEEEWDAVIAVHLKGHFAPTRHAAAHWRERSKAGDEVRARVINTSSPSGVFGNVGQANYGAAKAGIAGFTLIVAQELGRRRAAGGAAGALPRGRRSRRDGRRDAERRRTVAARVVVSSVIPARRRLYVMRHAQVRYFQGVHPEQVVLTDEGRRQAEAAAEELSAIRFDRVVTSGLARTLETAGIVARGAEPEHRYELREIE